MVGPVGGFGWVLHLNQGAPKIIEFQYIEVDPATPLMLSIPYPQGTTFSLTAFTLDCIPGAYYACSHSFTQASSIAAVRKGNGDSYYVDANGVLTLRIIQFPNDFVGNPWKLWNWTDPGEYGNGFALGKFARDGVVLPHDLIGDNFLRLVANCPGSGNYCSTELSSYDPEVCPNGFAQVAYDRCCQTTNPSNCVFADGSYT
jgi:hypothetical protein